MDCVSSIKVSSCPAHQNHLEGCRFRYPFKVAIHSKNLHPMMQRYLNDKDVHRWRRESPVNAALSENFGIAPKRRRGFQNRQRFKITYDSTTFTAPSE